MFLGKTHELGNVIVACEVIYSFLRLMRIPENINTNGIHAEGFAHLNAMLPVFAWNTGVMHLGCLNGERLAVKKERLVTYLECVSIGLCLTI